MRKGTRAQALLKRRLENLYRTYDRGFLESDPLLFVHRYSSDEDREVVGLIASSLAYGRVAGIKKSVEKVLAILGDEPARFVGTFRPRTGGQLFDGFRHRFNVGNDISCLLYFARQMMEKSGSIGNFFMEGFSKTHKNIKEALTSFSSRVLSLQRDGIYGRSRALPGGAGVRFFFPSPASGSPCKRLNLYLRWMVRRDDGLDLGLWRGIPPSKLVIPLDTHIARIASYLGLTRRKSRDWKMAEEITASLARLDPSDPVKYDFALCRLGILDVCPQRREMEKCAACLIGDICTL